MSRKSQRELSESIASNRDRFVDLEIRIALQDEHGVLHDDAEVLISGGGRWDRISKCFLEQPATTAQILGVHRGQEESARFLTRWIEAKTRDEITRTSSGKPVYSVLLHGGRRAGKTVVAVYFALLYAVMRPWSKVWLISESFDKTGELADYLERWLPSAWYHEYGRPEPRFVLPNGSVIWLRSGHKPRTLKRGQCDLAVLNEAQNMPKQVFDIIRPATTDSGGLTILAANPPDEDMAIGFWIEDFFEEARAGVRPALEIAFDNAKNPHIDRESLRASKDELDERTYLREIEGVFLPRKDIVFHAWSNAKKAGNIRELDPGLPDVTVAFTRKHLGRDDGFDYVLGMDFQKMPYPCAVTLRFFGDVERPFVWATDVTLVHQGLEEDLAAALIAKGYNPDRCAIVADASGAYQDIEREVKGHGSYDTLKQCGWRFIYTPDASMEKNPDISERVKVGNAFMKSAAGERRLFTLPELLPLNEAIKKWEMKHGAPYRKSNHAHLCDALTYPLWRFFPRRLIQVARVEYETIQAPRKENIWGGEDD